MTVSSSDVARSLVRARLAPWLRPSASPTDSAHVRCVRSEHGVHPVDVDDIRHHVQTSARLTPRRLTTRRAC